MKITARTTQLILSLLTLLVLLLAMSENAHNILASTAQQSLAPTTLAIAELATQADLIVRGQVTAQMSQWSADHSRIETIHTVAVHYAVAGVAPTTVQLTTEGGYLASEGLGMRSTDVAQLALNEEVLLFLRQADSEYDLVAEEAGKLTVVAGRAINSELHTDLALDKLYDTVAAALVDRADKLLLPAEWQSLETNPNNVQAAAPADYVLEDLHWPGAYPEILLKINPNAPEAGTVDGTVEDFLLAITHAAITWSVVPGAAFTLLYGGRIDATDVTYNGVNEVIFYHGGQNSIAGRSRIWYDNSRTILEADFWLNADLNWDALGDPDNTEIDVESVAVHELGHWLGLGHDTSPGAVMYASITQGTLRRELQASDIAGISSLYPCANPPCVADEYVQTTATPTATSSSTATATATPSATPTATDTPTETPTPTVLATLEPSGTPTTTATPTLAADEATTTPTPSPTLTLGPDGDSTPTPSATPADASAPTETATSAPTIAPTIIDGPGATQRTYLPLVQG